VQRAVYADLPRARHHNEEYVYLVVQVLSDPFSLSELDQVDVEISAFLKTPDNACALFGGGQYLCNRCAIFCRQSRSRFSIPIRDLEGKPFQCLACDTLGYCMRTLKLPVAYLVSGTLELGDDSAAAAVDRKYLVERAVGDEDGRLASVGCRRGEPWREGDHVREQVPISQPHREGVRSPVGEARHRQPSGIHWEAIERLLKRPIDKLHVWAVAADQYVLGSPTRLRRKEEASLVGEVEEVADTAPGVAARSM
jgi:hypothetical protein